MPYNLLILPLVGGYFILTQFLYFKHTYSKLPSQQLLFSSILAGIVIVICWFIIREIAQYYFPDLIQNWYDISSHIHIKRDENNRYLWTFFGGFLLLLLFTGVSNFAIDKFERFTKTRAHLITAINKHGTELEKLFLKSAQNDGYLIQITLKNDKVYIGGLAEFREPKNISYLKFRPVYSGYRDNVTKKLNITTNYGFTEEFYKKKYSRYSVALKSIVQGLKKDRKAFKNPTATKISQKLIKEKIDDVVIILKVDEILSANPFDPNIFIKFKESQAKEDQ